MSGLSCIPVDPKQFSKPKKSTAVAVERQKDDPKAIVGAAAAAIPTGSSSHKPSPLATADGATASDSSLGSDKKRRRKRKQLTVCLTQCKYQCVRRVCERYGLKSVGDADHWNLFWTDLSVSVDRVQDVKSFQKINHFPGIGEISRKDLLARNMTRMRKLFPDDYDIAPMSWTMPADYGDFVAYSSKHHGRSFIAKPDNASQGKGIIVTSNSRDITHEQDCVVQQYIDKPFLIDGYKFDMRIYVLVTSCDPLRIYVYKDGLARFATIKYAKPTSQNTSQSCMHLTNYSINKMSSDFVHDDVAGSKRRLVSLNSWFTEHGYDLDAIWRRIEDVIIKTIISCQPVLKHIYKSCFPKHDTGASACFEVLGFDVLLDSKLKPWLIEVNHSPSYHTDQDMDKDIKEGLLMDALAMLSLESLDREQWIKDERQRVHDRLTKQLKDASRTKVSKTADNGDATQLKSSKGKAENQEGDPADADNETGTGNMPLPAVETAIAEHELQHSGGWRRVYPFTGSDELYTKFFVQGGAIFGQTAASRARLQHTRSLKGEQDAKALEAQRLHSKAQAKKGKAKVPSLSGLPFGNAARVAHRLNAAGREAGDGTRAFDPAIYSNFNMSWEGTFQTTDDEEQAWYKSRNERSHIVQALGIKGSVIQYFRQASKAARCLNLTSSGHSLTNPSIQPTYSVLTQSQPHGGGGNLRRTNSPDEYTSMSSQAPGAASSSALRDELANGVSSAACTNVTYHYRSPPQTLRQQSSQQNAQTAVKNLMAQSSRSQISLYDLSPTQLPHDKQRQAVNAIAARPLGKSRLLPSDSLWVPDVRDEQEPVLRIGTVRKPLPDINTLVMTGNMNQKTAPMPCELDISARGLGRQRTLASDSRVSLGECVRSNMTTQERSGVRKSRAHLDQDSLSRPKLTVLQPKLSGSLGKPSVPKDVGSPRPRQRFSGVKYTQHAPPPINLKSTLALQAASMHRSKMAPRDLQPLDTHTASKRKPR